ncbi:MAG: DUF4160 domain-containing protein [Treponema sp.]|nr:DUF4160 domain-containing protein [Candidatus Treponema equifaecale]
MPELSRFLGIEITMYFNDHMPPHFHAEYNGQEAIFEISTLKKLEGSLPARVLGYVVEWATLHQVELQANWDSLHTDGKFNKIQPLV